MEALTDGHYYISLTIDVTSCANNSDGSHTYTPFLAVDEVKNYSGNMMQTSVNYMINPSPSRVMTQNVENIYWIGFGLENIPSIGVELSSDCLTPIDISVAQNNNELTANEINATYQWIDCSTNMPIPGETNEVFTASAEGSYAVEISKNGCMSTSTCYVIASLSVNDNMFNDVLIYPNPTKDLVNLNFGKNYDNISVELADIHGKVIYIHKYKNTDVVELSINAASGLYFLNLIADDKKSVHKIVKE